MQVRLHRKPGYLGTLVPIDVRVNGKKVSSLKRDETLTLQLSSAGVSLQVAMGTSTSPVVHLPPWSGSVELECGTPLWVLFDFLSIVYAPPFSGRAFFIRELARS